MDFHGVRVRIIWLASGASSGAPRGAGGHGARSVEAGKGLDGPCDLGSRDDLVLQSDHVEADAGRAERDLGLLVEPYRRHRVEGDAFPDDLCTALVDAAFEVEGASELGAFDLEATGTVEALVERDFVQQGSQGSDLAVMVDLPDLPDPCRKQP
jgi:hypothetical protein